MFLQPCTEGRSLGQSHAEPTDGVGYTYVDPAGSCMGAPPSGLRAPCNPLLWFLHLRALQATLAKPPSTVQSMMRGVGLSYIIVILAYFLGE